ncbi:MAG: hypothetical protein ACUVQT_01985, partial [bacterium]
MNANITSFIDYAYKQFKEPALLDEKKIENALEDFAKSLNMIDEDLFNQLMLYVFLLYDRLRGEWIRPK